MTAFNKAWTLLKELSPSAQAMQDRARQFINDPKMGRSDRADAFHRQMNIEHMRNAQRYFQPQMKDYERMASQGVTDFNQAHRRGQRMNVRPVQPASQHPNQLVQQELDKNTYQTTLPQYAPNLNIQGQYPQHAYGNIQPLDPSTMEYEREFDRVHGDIE